MSRFWFRDDNTIFDQEKLWSKNKEYNVKKLKKVLYSKTFGKQTKELVGGIQCGCKTFFLKILIKIGCLNYLKKDLENN